MTEVATNQIPKNNSNPVLSVVKLQIGQKIWIVPSKHDRFSKQDPKEAIVSKVGRKYFELEGLRKRKFDIETLREESETNYKSQCYLTLQEILDEKEEESLTNQIRNIFKTYDKVNLSLDQLRKIAGVIEGKI